MKTTYNTLVMMMIPTLLGCLSIATPANAGWSMSTETAPYVYPGSEVHAYYSNVVQQEYELRVSLPASYRSEPDRAFPVVYVLDGQWYFTPIADIVGSVAVDNQVAEAVVVAITWGGENPEVDALRGRDYTPTAVASWPGSGGAGHFLTALETEIIPFIENLYRASKRRVIVGNSLSGLFVTYALLEKPRLFDGYLALGATLGWDDGYLYDRLNGLSQHHFPRGTRYYLGFGELDSGVTDFYSFTEAFTVREFRKIDFKTGVFEGLAHSSVNAVGYTYGLMHVLERPKLRLGKLLELYAGEYSFDIPDFPNLVVEASGNTLIAHIPGDPPLTLYPETLKLFYVEGRAIEAEFGWDPHSGLSVAISIYNTVYTATKVY